MSLENENRDPRIKQLDKEIAEAEARVETLQYLLRVQVANTFASRPADDRTRPPHDAHAQVQKLAAIHKARDQQCLYRICAGVTAFKVSDPDPNAVDGGTVLGLRFEVMSKARFDRPYFVMLNRPWPGSQRLRVHKHTVPTCIPLPGLARRHLPPPREGQGGGAESGKGAKQDLLHFARCLRREIIRYHNRIGAIADMRRDVGITGKRGPEEQDIWLVDVSAADPEAKQVKLEWADGRTGRVVMDEDGLVTQVVVFGPNGRDRNTARALSGRNLRIEELSGRLTKLREEEPRRVLELERGDQDGSLAGEDDDATASVDGP